MAFVREHAALLIASIAALVGVVLATLIHAFFMSPPVPAVGFDEGYIAAIGERMIDGRFLPYVDGASHRGPLLYWATAIASLLAGRFSWLALRMLAYFGCLLTLAGCFAVGVVAKRPLAGAIAVLVDAYFLLFVLNPGSGVAVNGEMIAAPLAVLALLFATLAVARGGTRRRVERLAFAAGACASGSMLTKQTALFIVLPLALWLAAVAWSDGSIRSRERWRTMAALGLGWLLPVVLVVTRYAIGGELRTFWYWFYGYNAEIYMRPYASVSANQEVTNWITSESVPFVAVCLLLVWSLAKAVAPIARIPKGDVAVHYREVGFESTVALLAAITLASALAPLRFWGHYFVLAAPWFGLLVGIRGEEAIGTDDSARTLLRRALVALGVAGFVGWALHARLNGLNDERMSGAWGPAAPEPLCDTIAKHAGPDDPIFIWGFDGDLYITCSRKPASRFTYTTLVAGIVPPFWRAHEPELVADGARETLAADLESTRPKVILDIPARLAELSILDVPKVSDVVKAHYCELAQARGRGFRTAHPFVLRGDAPCPEVPPRKKTKVELQTPFRLELFAPKR